MFRCVDSALTIAACLSSKSPFLSPFKKREEAHAKKMKWFAGHSDHLTLLKVFKVIRHFFASFQHFLGAGTTCKFLIGSASF